MLLLLLLMMLLLLPLLSAPATMARLSPFDQLRRNCPAATPFGCFTRALNVRGRGQCWGKVAQWGLLLKMNPVPLSLCAPPCPLNSLLSHCSLARWPFRVQFSVIISFIARTLLAFGGIPSPCGFSPRMLQLLPLLLPLPLALSLPLPRLLSLPASAVKCFVKFIKIVAST